jgi:6,7-dimethyl-8-ribityllumazine synthase
MQGADQGQSANLQGSDLSIGIVRARFNEAITSKTLEACLAELAACGVESHNILQVTVPGALEIPVALEALADSEDYDALIASRDHRVSLDHQIPIANVVLTVENEAQAWARAETKGRDAARVAIEMANLMDDLL